MPTPRILKRLAANQSRYSFISPSPLNVDIVTTNLNLASRISGGRGNDSIRGGNSNDTLNGGDGRDTLNGGAGNDILLGDKGNDVLLGGNGNDFLDGGADNDLLDGGEGNDTLLGGSGNDTLLGGNGNDSLLGSDGNDSLLGGDGNDTINGGAGNDTLDGGTGADTMSGGDGNDLYIVDNALDIVSESALVGGGIDTIISSVNYTLSGGVENLTLSGPATVAQGNSLANSITGNSLANTLNGGTGADTMSGGDGNDVYIVDNALDIVSESTLVGGGIDTVISSLNYTLGGGVENLTLAGSATVAQGNSLANSITGNSLANTLNGGTGADTMSGGDGNDVYLVDNAGDLIIEASSQSSGVDTILSSINYTLGGGQENLTLSNSAAVGFGNNIANYLVGTAQANTLNGSEGTDTMDGAEGDDVYIIDNEQDVIIELDDAGSDKVMSAVTYLLAQNVENLELLGGDNIDGIGNSLDNSLVGNSVENYLDGGAGNDFMNGGLGDDVIYGGNSEYDDNGDIVAEDGVDTLLGGDGNDLLLASNEETNLIGDLLDGGSGNDTLIGGYGDDTIVNDATDAIADGGEGIDTVLSNTSVLLAATRFSNVENIVLVGDGNITATGDSLDNEIYGNAGDNTLDGGDGTDLLAGGAGDDVYLVDEFDLAVVEIEEEGTDLVISGTDHTLADNVENLVLTGDLALSGTGNSLGNEITGNSLDNILSGLEGDDTLIGDEGADSLLGGAGADSLVGGEGDDTLGVDDSDLSIEGGDGTDLVVSESDIDLTDGRFTSVENIILTDIYVDEYIEDPDTGEQTPTGETVLSEIQPISATGDSLANTIVGNLADNSLNGGVGADILDGGAGDDILFIDSDDTLVDGNDGIDAIVSETTVALSETRFANVENIILSGEENISATGDDIDNQLIGNDANNTLDGGAGADYLSGGDGDDSLLGGEGIDTMIGGAGNDTLVLDISDYTGDTLSSALVDGDDGVDLVVADFSIVLDESTSVFNVENILLTGSDSLTATGDGSANHLTGNAGANTLAGAGGFDTLTGGGEADLFVLGSASAHAYGGTGADNLFALITDFTVGTDALQLKGTSASDFDVNYTNPSEVLITSNDATVGLVAKINVVDGDASTILSNATFV
jgi:Ca2+-binding RTX toxin-like protein